MNAVNEILSRIPLDQLAGELGTDEATAEQAAREAVASLMGGMQSNAASSPAGEASLAGALNQHSSSSFFTDSRIDLNQVDTADGEKIVSHVLGSSDAQPAALGGLLGSAQVQKLLKMLAPIVIGYLAGKVTNGGFGDILGGGGSAEQNQQPSGGGLGDILGQIFGGGNGGGGTTSAESFQQGDSPFNTPETGGSTDKFPTEGFPTGSEQTQQQEEKKESGGGILGDILGGLFGKK
ncbi:hypothetical protein GCM10028820_12460 [Tessaracoccus terricola]